MGLSAGINRLHAVCTVCVKAHIIIFSLSEYTVVYITKTMHQYAWAPVATVHSHRVRIRNLYMKHEINIVTITDAGASATFVILASSSRAWETRIRVSEKFRFKLQFYYIRF